MSDFARTMQRLGELRPGLFARRTLMGGASRDVPPLPLTSRDISLPAPAINRPQGGELPACRVREFRGLVTALRRQRHSLDGWDATLVAELARWRRPPSEWEAQQIALLAERAFWATRDGAAPC